ncbi:hypothetical protein MRX96_008258 [Rhipicephalus microplus]
MRPDASSSPCALPAQSGSSALPPADTGRVAHATGFRFPSQPRDTTPSRRDPEGLKAQSLTSSHPYTTSPPPSITSNYTGTRRSSLCRALRSPDTRLDREIWSCRRTHLRKRFHKRRRAREKRTLEMERHTKSGSLACPSSAADTGRVAADRVPFPVGVSRPPREPLCPNPSDTDVDDRRPAIHTSARVEYSRTLVKAQLAVRDDKLTFFYKERRPNRCL